jgi:ribosomal protein L11 methyltransferase
MSFQRVDILPFWRVINPALETESSELPAGVSLLKILPGRGFGVGTHETTQLCLLALGHLLRAGKKPSRVLDFGTGSGILAIALALSGTRVEAIDIDELALEHARQNARLNGVESLIDFRAQLSEPTEPFDIVISNILNQVLLDHADALAERQSRQGRMILSGLLPTDVPAILGRYKPLLAPMRPQIYERGQWRTVVFLG